MEFLNTDLFDEATTQAYYRMNSGALTTDSKNSNTLTNNNTVGESSDGWYGYCADFGTSNTNKTLSIASALSITNAGSISMWVKMRTEIASGSQTLAAVSSNANKFVLYIDYAYNGGTRRLEFHRSRVGVADVSANYTVTLGTSDWHHIVLVFDGSNVRGYVDNVVSGDAASSGDGTAAAATATTIGGNINTDASAYIDDVVFISKGLSADEVGSIYLTDYRSINVQESISLSESFGRCLIALINESEGITISESLNPCLVSDVNIQESMTVSENLDQNIRNGSDLNVSIWQDTISVTENIEFPGPRDNNIEDRISINERVTVKIVTPTDTGYKPSFKVSP